MIDDSMSNVLCKYLEGVITMQDKEIQSLLKERGDAEGRAAKAEDTVDKKNRDMEAMMEHVHHLTASIERFSEERVKLLNEVAAYKANYKPLNDLIDLLEEEVNDAEHEVLGLKDQRELNHRRLDEKDNIIVGLRDDLIGAERFVKRLEDECLAIAIQAAESEDRADNERRGRLQLVMRM